MIGNVLQKSADQKEAEKAKTTPSKWCGSMTQLYICTMYTVIEKLVNNKQFDAYLVYHKTVEL